MRTPVRTDTTVTLSFCGTKNHQDMDDRKAVSHLAKNTVGYEKADRPNARASIFDGPGGKPIPDDERAQGILASDASAHRNDPARRFKAAKHQGRDLATRVQGAAKGYGTQSNIIGAISWLANAYADTPFDTINPVGFSRGGVTCIMLAHAIAAHQVFREMVRPRVNIFAFDLVPGGDLTKTHSSLNDFGPKPGGSDIYSTFRAGQVHTLPDCVTAYRAIVEENLAMTLLGVLPKDSNCRCVLPTAAEEARPGEDDYEIFAMPGDHEASNLMSEEGAGRLGAHLCQRFLEA